MADMSSVLQLGNLLDANQLQQLAPGQAPMQQGSSFFGLLNPENPLMPTETVTQIGNVAAMGYEMLGGDANAAQAARSKGTDAAIANQMTSRPQVLNQAQPQQEQPTAPSALGSLGQSLTPAGQPGPTSVANKNGELVYQITPSVGQLLGGGSRPF